MKFSIGNFVKWRSQSGGVWREKEGKIIAIIAAYGDSSYDAYSRQTCKQMGLLQTHSLAPMAFCGPGRDHESYLVEVRDTTKPRSKPRIYWPRVEYLEFLGQPKPKADLPPARP